jgi:hypothetical protein
MIVIAVLTSIPLIRDPRQIHAAHLEQPLSHIELRCVLRLAALLALLWLLREALQHLHRSLNRKRTAIPS